MLGREWYVFFITIIKHGVCQQRSLGKSYTKLDSYLYLNL
ncbi:hypothetical protein D1BOALGB6SA_9257 [Olavius sp. associated proteobacterium Delta 1]|nr:hypothetical protein D1BOALGB6SA_9257 [Olavius sp. associated proteobacterium Delta 1]